MVRVTQPIRAGVRVVKHLMKILAFGALVTGTPAYAGNPHHVGSTVRLHWSMPLRQSPSGGYFRGLAPQGGLTQSSQRHTVEDTKTVTNLARGVQPNKPGYAYGPSQDYQNLREPCDNANKALIQPLCSGGG
jgi:hypothetical protein